MSSQSPRLYFIFNCQLKAKSENGDGRTYNQERFEDATGVFRSRRSKTDRQYCGEEKMD